MLLLLLMLLLTGAKAVGLPMLLLVEKLPGGGRVAFAPNLGRIPGPIPAVGRQIWWGGMARAVGKL